MAHVERKARIHAPLATVWATAHDPRHWSDWYVGISDERELEPTGSSRDRRLVMVGTPFPLTQRVEEDRLGKTEARWCSKPTAAPDCADVSRFCKLLLLSSAQSWSYSEHDGETEVRAVVDFSIPEEVIDSASDEATVEEIEGQCLEESLRNLKVLCETHPTPVETTRRHRWFRGARPWLS